MQKYRGRGYSENTPGRFASTHTVLDLDAIRASEYPSDNNQMSEIILTELSHVHAESILTHNTSPDIPFERSLNIYRGCEHGCIYCFARPTHSYLDLSPGIDFEQKIFIKSNAVTLLKKEFMQPGYEVKTISLGNITDTYQPVEKRLGLTRKILQLMLECKHPVSLVTKSSLVERDLDILELLAKENLVHVAISITTLNKNLARQLEPRAASPQRRLKTIKALKDAKVPTSVLVAPIIPLLTDAEIENILSAAKQVGCSGANYVILRLPNEMQTLFVNWLQDHFPLKAKHVLNRLSDMYGGKIYNAEYVKRMRGTGEYASMLNKRFKLACKRYKLEQNLHALDTSNFIRPNAFSTNTSKQLEMF